MPAARLVLARDPECYRACDAMCRVPGVSNLHEATAIGPQALDGIFPSRLKSLAPVLPAGMSDLPSRSDVVKCLVDREVVLRNVAPTLVTEDESRRSA